MQRFFQTKKETRSFLGMVNYYSAYIPDVSTLTKPLRELTELKTNFEWTEQCQSAFEKCKAILASDLVLMLYNPDLPIVVSADASPVGVGATLSHQVTVDGKIVERPVAYASCSLTARQQKYSQLSFLPAFGLRFWNCYIWLTQALSAPKL